MTTSCEYKNTFYFAATRWALKIIKGIPAYYKPEYLNNKQSFGKAQEKGRTKFKGRMTFHKATL